MYTINNILAWNFSFNEISFTNLLIKFVNILKITFSWISYYTNIIISYSSSAWLGLIQTEWIHFYFFSTTISKYHVFLRFILRPKDLNGLKVFLQADISNRLRWNKIPVLVFRKSKWVWLLSHFSRLREIEIWVHSSLTFIRWISFCFHIADPNSDFLSSKLEEVFKSKLKQI